jgi:lipid-binding SYLF domain-containing protein
MKKIVLFSLISLMSVSLFAQPNPDQTVNNATKALEDLIGNSQNQIPKWLLDTAQGILVVPNYNGKPGQGVYSVKNNGKWSLPVLANVKTNGNANVPKDNGLLVVVYMPGAGTDGLKSGNITSAGNGVAAGPSGNQSASSFNEPRKNIEYIYVGNPGNVKGVKLDQVEVIADTSAMTKYYGSSNASIDKIMSGQVKAPYDAKNFQSTLQSKS